ncbi:NAD(P)-dependent oxidoreductase [Streptomyces sparsogenes]|uniref:NAD(P)-dependent oxidoreductase n=1 Tax=Streptomyces sparsogenes TaxID=67365 RepID=UPI00384FBA45
MARIAVFGAGGRVGRHLVAEADGRGHQVTAVVRDPAKYPGLAAGNVTVVAGDVTDPAGVAAAVAGHDAVISSIYREDIDAKELYGGAARALLAGLGEAGVGRLVVVGLAATLETEPGVRVLDAPGFPESFRTFSLGHAAGLDVLRSASDGVDWLVVNPPMSFEPEGARTGRYRRYGGRLPPGGGRVSHADFAIAVLDEIEKPETHRTQLAIAD